MSAQTMFVLGGLALLGLVAVWNSGRKTVNHGMQGASQIGRVGGNVLRAVVTTAVIVAVQYAVIRWVHSPIPLLVVLVVPALFAGATVARLLAVTEVVSVRGGRR